MQYRVVPMLASALILATGCGGGGDAAPAVQPSYRATACANGTVLPAGVQLTCGVLTVPESRAADNRGRKVELAVLRLSQAGRVSSTPLLWLQGGPGEAASVDLNTWAESSTLAERDVILFDQRGTGLSSPALSCPEIKQVQVAHFTQPGGATAELDRAREAVRGCVRRWADRGVNLGAYNSIETAHDVRDLRAQLGLQQWHVYGVSYGTRAALAVMRYAPEGLASVVLDSGSPPELSTALRVQAADAELALARLFAACSNRPSCKAEVGDLSARFEAMVDRYNRQPWRIEAAISSGPAQLTVTGDDLVALVTLLMKNSEFLPQLPAFIAALAAGDTATALPTVQPLLVEGLLAPGEDYTTTQLAVDCNDLKRLSTPQDRAFDRAPGRWRLVALISSGPFCDLLPGSGNPASYNQPVVSSVPTLLLAGELDPATLPERTAQAGSGLQQKRYVQIAGAGHVPGMGTACGQEVLNRFLAGPGRFETPDCAAAAGP
jgi:pimeloyl-ACP methyl ester carboxylesterase